MFNRRALTDSLLIALAGAVIVLAMWPSPPRRQTLIVTADDGTEKPYSLPLGDPTLQQLRERIARADDPLPPAKLAIAKWTRDLAAHYAAACQSEDCRLTHHDTSGGSVITVSYDDSGSHDLPLLTAEATRRYWEALRADAELAIVRLEKEMEHRERALSRIVFAEIIDGRVSLRAYVAAFSVGLLMALVCALWMRIRQRIAVISRQLVLLTVTAGALLCALFRAACFTL